MEGIHAACVVLGRAGILIRGPSGAGKSSLALLLADSPEGALVADDRVQVSLAGGRLVARAHPAEAGRVEIRGQGLLTAARLGLSTQAEATLTLVVDLVESSERMPPPPEDATILGTALPRLVLDRGVREAGLARLLVKAALHGTIA